MDALSQRGSRIRVLNDLARKTFLGTRIMLTATVAEMDEQPKARLLQAVRDYNTFDDDNDPHHEHDMGFLDFEGEKYMFKFDYYDKKMEYGSEDPGDEMKTCRVLTIMRSDEY